MFTKMSDTRSSGYPLMNITEDGVHRVISLYRLVDSWVRLSLKRPNPLGLKCDTITSPRRLVNTFIQQMIPDLLKRDKPIKVVINFKSWSTTQDISSEWG
jgi:hypothetical protein